MQAIIFFLVIFSLRTKNESAGINIADNDSNAGMSLSITPCENAVILIINEQKNIQYAVITLQFNIERSQELCSRSALFLSNS